MHSLNLNSLLVKRQIDNSSPGTVLVRYWLVGCRDPAYSGSTAYADLGNIMLIQFIITVQFVTTVYQAWFKCCIVVVVHIDSARLGTPPRGVKKLLSLKWFTIPPLYLHVTHLQSLCTCYRNGPEWVELPEWTTEMDIDMCP